MMEGKKKLVLTSLATAFSVLATLAISGYRIYFIFIDKTVHLPGFSYLLWTLFILNTVCLFFQLASVIKKRKTISRGLFIANCVIAAVALAVGIVFPAVLPSEIPSFIGVGKILAPYLAIVYALLFFILIFPNFKTLLRRITSAVLALVIFASAVSFLFPFGGFKIESAPVVFDTGSDYRVVFATNRRSIGCVTYEYNGKSYVLWDAVTGRKESSRIHSVSVPYEHLNNNGYSVRASRAIEDISYGGRLGKEKAIDIEKFVPCPDDNFDMVCITDNHGAKPDWDKLTGSGDIYAFLGDISNGIYSDSAVIDNLIIPAGISSQGAAPTVFVRGNHDIKGSHAQKLAQSLDFDNYYYRIRNGKYTFTVFDSGEDKSDDNFEYGGYNDYSSYRAEQLEWARELERQDGYNVIIAHSRDILDGSEEDSAEVAEILKNLGCDFLVCGHSHKTKYVTAEDSDTGIQYYICGVKSGERDIKYTVMHFENGNVSVLSEKLSDKEKLCEAQIALRNTEKQSARI